MGKALTAKQRAILEFIRAETARRGFPPTIREIGAHFGMRSTGSVRDHLRALERKGHISRRNNLSRGIVLRGGVGAQRRPAPPRHQGIPLVGETAAGNPQLAIENPEDVLGLDPALFGGGELFALRVEGESMREAGILDGDIVVVRRQSTAENGEIVVALIEDEATVKRFFRRGNQVELRPENPQMEPLRLRPGQAEVMVLGKVVGVVRRF